MLLSNNRLKTIYLIVIVGILLSGVLLTVYGFWKSSTNLTIPWEGRNVMIIFYGFSFTIFLSIYFLTKFFKNIPLASLAIIVLISIICNKIWCLIAVAWIILSAIILGSLIINKIGLRKTWLDCFLLGIGTIGTIIGLLAHFPINYSGIYALVLAIFCFFNRKTVIEIFSDVKLWHKNYKLPASSFNKFGEFFVFTLILIYFVVALMPELSYDPLAMHLFIPAKLDNAHFWDFNVNKYVWSVMPMLGNWIYSLAYMFGGETAARLMNFSLVLALTFILRKIAVWASNSLSAGYIVCAIFLTSPLTFGVSANLFVESVWSVFVIAGISKLLFESEKPDENESQPKILILVGIFMGFAIASKLMAVLATSMCLIVILNNYKIWFQWKAIKSILTGFFLFTLLGCIPYVTSWILTGNPIFPFFNKVFRSPLWLLENFTDDRWSIPIGSNFLYSVTFETNKYLEAFPGAAGFQWLVFLPLCLLVLIITYRRKGILLAVISIIFIGLVYHSTVYLRYIFPAYSILCVVIGVALVEIRNYSKIIYSLSIFILVLVLFLNLTFLSAPFYVYRDFPVESIVSDASRSKYLSKIKPIRNIIQTTNLLNLKQKPVAIFSEPFGAQLNSDALYTNWYNPKWQQAFSEVKDEEEMANLLSDYRVEYLILDESFNFTKEQRVMIENLTDRITQISQIQLRTVKKKNGFTKELLKNPNLEDRDGWQMTSEEIYNQSSRTVLVNEKSPVVQRIKIKPDNLYSAQITSKCLNNPTQGRVQVNWQDENGRFIKADIKVFDCTENWSENSMEIVSPSNASYADFYLSSHSDIKIQVNAASLKE